MSFGPQQRDIKEVGITSLASLISGIIGSVMLIVLVLFVSRFINILDSFQAASVGAGKSSMLFIVVLSIIAFFVTSLTIFITYFFLHFSNPDRYRKSFVIYGQIALFTILTYIFIIPAYIYAGRLDYDYLIIIFLIHIILVVFGVNLIIEILNNYRYVLVSVYGSFIALFLVLMLVSLSFSMFSSPNAKLVSLLFLLPLINFLQVLMKGLFDFIYFHYNRITNQDPVGDIFYQIELEEKEALKEEEEKNSI